MLRGKSPSYALVYYALKYYILSGIANHIDVINEYILNSDDPQATYSYCASTIASISKEALIKMLNNEKLNSNIKLEVLKKMDWFLQTLGSTYKIEKEVDNSLIAKLIKDVKKHE